MKRKLIAYLLMAALLVMLLPAVSGAAKPLPKTAGTATISICDDAYFVASPATGEYMHDYEVSIADVAAVDLAANGLGDYVYDKDGNDISAEPTLLKLFVYLTLQSFGSLDGNFVVSGSSGSTFITNFWGHDCNLTYYENGDYPLEREGWGATSDRIIVDDGDFFYVSMYTSWKFYSDSNAGYHYFTDDAGAITKGYTVTAGEPLNVNLIRRWASMSGDYTTASYPAADVNVYWGTEYSTEGETFEAFATTDENGAATLTFAQAGTYVIWCDGQYGLENPDDIVSAPGYAVVTVAPSASQPLAGDVNCDGVVNFDDISALYAMLINISEPSAQGRANADYSGDGEITFVDVSSIYAMLLSL